MTPVTECRPEVRFRLLRRLYSADWESWSGVLAAEEQELWDHASTGEYAWITDNDEYDAELAAQKEWLRIARREAEALGELEVMWPGENLRLTDAGKAAYRRWREERAR